MKVMVYAICLVSGAQLGTGRSRFAVTLVRSAESSPAG